MTVLGEVKIVGLLILSAIILPGESSQFTARMTVGCVLAMLGFCLYSNTKLLAARRAAARQAGQPQKPGSDVEEGRPLLQVRLLLSHRSDKDPCRLHNRAHNREAQECACRQAVVWELCEACPEMLTCVRNPCKSNGNSDVSLYMLLPQR